MSQEEVRELLMRAGYGPEEIAEFFGPDGETKLSSNDAPAGQGDLAGPISQTATTAMKQSRLKRWPFFLGLFLFVFVFLPVTASFWAGLAYFLSFFVVGIIFIPFAIVGNTLLGLYLHTYALAHNSLYHEQVEEAATCGSLAIERRLEQQVTVGVEYPWTGTPVLRDTDISKIEIVNGQGERAAFGAQFSENAHVAQAHDPETFGGGITLSESAGAITIPETTAVTLGTALAAREGDKQAQGRLGEASGSYGISRNSHSYVGIKDTFLRPDEYEAIRTCAEFKTLATRMVTHNMPPAHEFYKHDRSLFIHLFYDEAGENPAQENVAIGAVELTCKDGSKFRTEGPYVRMTLLEGGYMEDSERDFAVGVIEPAGVRPLSAEESVRINEIDPSHIGSRLWLPRDKKQELDALRACVGATSLCPQPVQYTYKTEEGYTKLGSVTESEDSVAFNHYLPYSIRFLEAYVDRINRDPEIQTDVVYAKDPKAPLPYELGSCVDQEGKVLDSFIRGNRT